MKMTNREIKMALTVAWFHELVETDGKWVQSWAALRNRVMDGLKCNTATADAAIQENIDAGKLFKYTSQAGDFYVSIFKDRVI